jgi:4-deoxy-L-threo-5-hexosulose-uronate ketol-isomerase
MMTLHESFYPSMAAAAAPENLRKEFLVPGLFQEGETHLFYWETDRTIVGGIIPTTAPLSLSNPESMRAAFFLERREAGVVNLGGPGKVVVDGTEYILSELDALYLGRGVRDVKFSSAEAKNPARYYLLSYPAHASFPVRRIAFNQVKGESLGTREAANERTLHKLIEPSTISTCQLVMGVTCLQPGSVWNTMPPHTHLRRSEVYLYFDVPQDQSVFHFMGAPAATRHLVVRNFEAVLSPPWSIHSGVGTRNYRFVWGMGGENQEFSDMDSAPVSELK